MGLIFTQQINSLTELVEVKMTEREERFCKDNSVPNASGT